MKKIYNFPASYVILKQASIIETHLYVKYAIVFKLHYSKVMKIKSLKRTGCLTKL